MSMNHHIDKELVKERFSKASATYSTDAVVQKHIAQQMNNIIRNFVPASNRNNVLEIGCGTGLFTRMYLKDNIIDRLVMNDICDNMECELSDLIGENISFMPGDAENMNFPENQDMIVSCSAIQWFEDPIGFMERCRSKLRPSGILAISSFAPDNFREISSLSSCSLKYIPVETIKNSLSKYYDIIYCSEEKMSLFFDTPEDVLRHLKRTGVNGIRKESWTRSNLRSFCSKYRELYSTDNDMVTLTYNPIYIICKKKNNEEK